MGVFLRGLKQGTRAERSSILLGRWGCLVVGLIAALPAKVGRLKLASYRQARGTSRRFIPFDKLGSGAALG